MAPPQDQLPTSRIYTIGKCLFTGSSETNDFNCRFCTEVDKATIVLSPVIFTSSD